MNLTFLKAVVAVMPASMLFSGSVVLFRRGKTLWSFLQLLGAGCLEIVVLAHFTEALNLFLGCIGGLSIALVTTSIYQVPFSVSRCFL